MEEETLLTPQQEILVGLAIGRFRQRVLWKRNPKLHPQRDCTVITKHKACKLFLAVEHLSFLTQHLKALLLIPKFCNGLIGVSLTDSLPAAAINGGAVSPML